MRGLEVQLDDTKCDTGFANMDGKDETAASTRVRSAQSAASSATAGR